MTMPPKTRLEDAIETYEAQAYIQEEERMSLRAIAEDEGVSHSTVMTSMSRQ
jgi:hypothetical protein